MRSAFVRLQERCEYYEFESAKLVFSRCFESDGSDCLLRVTKHNGEYTMTCAFMVNGVAMCSIDVHNGTAEQVFEKLADRMLL